MTVGLLIISHDEVGNSLLASATGILGLCPLHTQSLSVSPGDALEDIRTRATGLLRDLRGGDGVLILTDLLGSTPSNVASLFQRPGEVNVVAGLKVLSHPSQSLQRLTELAMEGGQQGVRPGMPQSVHPLPKSAAGK